MSTTSTVRLDDGVREETTRIASEMGLSFNAVMNILARRFNAEKGFPFPVRLTIAQKSVFDLSSDECQWQHTYQICHDCHDKYIYIYVHVGISLVVLSIICLLCFYLF